MTIPKPDAKHGEHAAEAKPAASFSGPRCPHCGERPSCDAQCPGPAKPSASAETGTVSFVAPEYVALLVRALNAEKAAHAETKRELDNMRLDARVEPVGSEAAGCVPCFTCGGFRLPARACTMCAGAREALAETKRDLAKEREARLRAAEARGYAESAVERLTRELAEANAASSALNYARADAEELRDDFERLQHAGYVPSAELARRSGK